MNKGNIDVFKVRYILNKQKKNLERNEMIDVDQATENLTAVKAFFYQVDCTIKARQLRKY